MAMGHAVDKAAVPRGNITLLAGKGIGKVVGAAGNREIATVSFLLLDAVFIIPLDFELG